MEVTDRVVHRIAALARLRFSAEELPHLRRQLETILRFAGQLEDVDTRGVPPTDHVHDAGMPPRPDEPEASLPPGQVEALAPSHRDGRIATPPALETRKG